MPVCILVCYELVLGISLGTLTVVEMCKTFAKKKKAFSIAQARMRKEVYGVHQ